MSVKRAWRVIAVIAVLAAITPALTTSGAGHWTGPINLSNWNENVYNATWLRIGADGTQAAFWAEDDSWSAGYRLLARVRPAVGDRGDVQDVTGFVWGTVHPPYWAAEVAPDGTVWVVWTVPDYDRPAGSQWKVYVTWRLPDGTWQQRDLSGWVAQARAVDFDVGPDGDLVAVWVACDTTDSNWSSGSGPCAVNARRRPAGSAAWGATRQLNSLMGLGGY